MGDVLQILAVVVLIAALIAAVVCLCQINSRYKREEPEAPTRRNWVSENTPNRSLYIQGTPLSIDNLEKADNRIRFIVVNKSNEDQPFDLAAHLVAFDMLGHPVNIHKRDIVLRPNESRDVEVITDGYADVILTY